MRGAVRLVVDGLVVEDVCLLCLGESAARVGDGNLHIAVALRCADGDAAACRGELPGIVGKGVDHEERQHPVGLDDGGAVSDTEVYAFHLESHASLLHDVEHLLHGEALDVERQAALAQLDPLREHGVQLVDLVGQFTDVRVAFCLQRVALAAFLQHGDLVEHTVDEGDDAVDERHLRPLLEVLAPVVDEVDPVEVELFRRLVIPSGHFRPVYFVLPPPLFERHQQVVQRLPAVPPPPQVVEEHQQGEDDEDGECHGGDDEVELL